VTTLLERLEAVEALVAAPPPAGGPAERTKADYGYKSKGGGRHVASQAGVARYGLPIGTPLGKGKAQNEQDAYNRFRDQKTPADLSRTAGYLSNGDLALTAKGVFGVNGSNEWDKAAQVALVKELAARGIDPHSVGYKGGYVALSPNPKQDPTEKAAQTVQKAADRAAKAAASAKAKAERQAQTEQRQAETARKQAQTDATKAAKDAASQAVSRARAELAQSIAEGAITEREARRRLAGR
jgi:hypothetical protein